MLSHLFYRHGKFCASHPWEVIVAFLTLTICMVFMGTTVIGSTKMCGYKCLEENKGVEIVLMTIMRCIAVLYGYHQFKKLYKLGSTYLVGIALLFTITAFSSFVFCTSVINFLDGDFSELNKALPFFFLLIDLTKAGLLAQFALSSSTKDEVRENIAQGMSVIGPTITLDTIVETLVIGVGTLSGVKRLEEMCCFACMSAVVNYLVFMAFFPACLSLILEVSRDRDEGRPLWHLSTLTRVLQQEEEQKPNPVLQRVKVIMSAGLVLVHAHSRWPILLANNNVLEHHNANLSPTVDKMLPFTSDYHNWDISMQKWWFAISAEQMVILVLTCALAVKYLFFESRDELSEQLASAAMSSPSRCIQSYKGAFTSKTVQTMPLTDNYSSQCRDQPTPGLSSVPHHVHTPLTPTNHNQPSSPVSYVVDGKEANKADAKLLLDKQVQTDETTLSSASKSLPVAEFRSTEECKQLLKAEDGTRTDEEVLQLCENRVIRTYELEGFLGDLERGVRIRRKFFGNSAKRKTALDGLPFRNYDYSLVMGSCCENVIGYVPIPVGIAGPLLLDNELFYIPMATTEGCLVASTNRGCCALKKSGGVKSVIHDDEMTRGPVIEVPTIEEAANIKKWLGVEENFNILKAAFDSTSRFARLRSIRACPVGCTLYLRFAARTGDAMGMNMVSKGCDEALRKLIEIFPFINIVSVSGNYCIDKKPAAINWILGRGKSVVCEATIPCHIVKQVLKTDVSAVVDLNIKKNLIGSAMAGSIGGFNAQAANIVTAIYLATGQDPAQNVTSSNCITVLKAVGDEKKDLKISCTMPSLELGTVGGGTMLPAQSASLKLLGVQGPCRENPGQNAAKLAKIVCAAVLAAELSLLSVLEEGQLVHSHMTHNRSSVSTGSSADTESQRIPASDANSPMTPST